MAVSPVLALPTRRMIANNSVSVKAWAPFSSSFSLGRSFAGHSLMLIGYRFIVTRQAALRLRGELQASARRSLYHNGWPSPILSRQALLDIRLPDDAGSPGGRWDGRVVLGRCLSSRT